MPVSMVLLCRSENTCEGVLSFSLSDRPSPDHWFHPLQKSTDKSDDGSAALWQVRLCRVVLFFYPAVLHSSLHRFQLWFRDGWFLLVHQWVVTDSFRCEVWGRNALISYLPRKSINITVLTLHFIISFTLFIHLKNLYYCSWSATPVVNHKQCEKAPFD